MKWIKLINTFDAAYSMSVPPKVKMLNSKLTCHYSIGNDGTKIYIQTNKDAPQYRLITIDLSDPNFTQIELVPEDKDAKLETADLVDNNKLALVYKRNVRNMLTEAAGLLTLLFYQFIGQGRIVYFRSQWEKIATACPRFCRKD